MILLLKLGQTGLITSSSVSRFVMLNRSIFSISKRRFSIVCKQRRTQLTLVIVLPLRYNTTAVHQYLIETSDST
ncbi:hypothetical protein AAFF_G00254380 [Aldrovandia affinis]|uniref:Uncharacterized protein n=1 Tax=Aldrovandia affinis TaxID=143900 RepID=A0AAD7W2E9_9TELE|nr:hypothetical protein AAFF_G00254380 [Aldrovandia affinis]